MSAALASKSIKYKHTADEESETKAKNVSKAISNSFPMHTPKRPMRTKTMFFVLFLYYILFQNVWRVSEVVKCCRTPRKCKIDVFMDMLNED